MQLLCITFSYISCRQGKEKVKEGDVFCGGEKPLETAMEVEELQKNIVWQVLTQQRSHFLM